MRNFIALLLLCLFLIQTPVLAQTSAPALSPFDPSEDCADSISAENSLCKAFDDGTCSESLGVKACVEKIEEIWIDKQKEEANKLKVELDKKKGFLPGFGGVASEILLLVSSAITAGVIAWLQKLRGKLSTVKDNLLKYKARLSDPVLPTPIEHSEVEGVNLVLIGEGGVGKTSLIRAISGSPHADPQSATDGSETYALAQEVDLIGRDKKPIRKLTRIYIEDHKGQDIAEMILTDLVEKRQKMVPSTVIAIVVDLFEPKDDDIKFPIFEAKRVKQQLSKYGSDFLKIIRKKYYNNGTSADKTVKAVCLFINKLDMFETINENTLKSAKNAYAPLIKDMRQKFADASFFVILGSASSGWGVVGHNEQNRGTEKTLQEIIMQSTTKIKIEPQS